MKDDTAPLPRSALTDPDALLDWVDREEQELLQALGDTLGEEEQRAVRATFERQRAVLSGASMFTSGYDHLARRVAVETRERQEFETDLRAVTHSLSLERTQLEARISQRTEALEDQNRRLEREVGLREAADRALRLANRRMQWALDTARGGFWSFDVQSGEYELSDDFARFLGLPPEQATFEAWLHKIHPEDRINHNLEPLLTGRVARLSTHYRLSHPVRGEILVQDNKNGLYEEGQLRAIHGFVFDVSSADAAQQELMRRGTELERVSYDADRLSRLVTHDLQEPLRQMLTFASMMTPSPASPDAERLRALMAATQRMQSKLNRMRDYVEVGQVPLRRERIPLEELVDQAEELLRARYSSVDFVLSRPAEATLYGDPTLLFQALTQLIENALRFRDLGRPLEVSVATAVADGFHRVVIRDNGTGLPAKSWEAVFQPMYQLDPGPEEDGRHLGLGLAVARRITQLHRGWAYVSWSEVGRGTAITLQLPVEEAPSTRPPRPEP